MNEKINELKSILNKCWGIDTCYSKCKDYWNEENKACGQCAITSVIVKNYFGGEIRKTIVNDMAHYFNYINEEVIDLTREQFKNNDIDYSNYKIKSVEEILENDDTKRRYEILNSRVNIYTK